RRRDAHAPGHRRVRQERHGAAAVPGRQAHQRTDPGDLLRQLRRGRQTEAPRRVSDLRAAADRRRAGLQRRLRGRRHPSPALPMIRRLLAALWATVPVLMTAPAAANTPPTPTVIAVEVISPHRLVGPPPEQALTDLVGRPLSRSRVRESLDRLWARGSFDRREAELAPDGDGGRLRYHVSLRPRVVPAETTGDLG